MELAEDVEELEELVEEEDAEDEETARVGSLPVVSWGKRSNMLTSACKQSGGPCHKSKWPFCICAIDAHQYASAAAQPR